MSLESKSSVKPADWYHRFAATLLDLVLLGVVVKIVAYYLPEGPPPVDAMAFFSKQDFYNYFILVGTAVLGTTLGFGLVAVPGIHATPGQLALGLRLRSLSGSEPSPFQIKRRWIVAVINVAILAVPGPLIALLVGTILASFLEVPFTTTDSVLIASGIPSVFRYAIHAISFIALFTGSWYVFVHPVLKRRERASRGLTLLDELTSSTHIIRSAA